MAHVQSWGTVDFASAGWLVAGVLSSRIETTQYEQTLPMTRTSSGQKEGARGLLIERKCPHPWKGLATDSSVSILNVILDICGSPNYMLSSYQTIHQKTQLNLSTTI